MRALRRTGHVMEAAREAKLYLADYPHGFASSGSACARRTSRVELATEKFDPHDRRGVEISNHSTGPASTSQTKQGVSGVEQTGRTGRGHILPRRRRRHLRRWTGELRASRPRRVEAEDDRPAVPTAEQRPDADARRLRRVVTTVVGTLAGRVIAPILVQTRASDERR